MNATTLTLARYLATKAIKAEMRARGLRPCSIEPAEINRAAAVYLHEHPELIERAAQRVATVPSLRELAEREARDRARRAKLSTDAKAAKPRLSQQSLCKYHVQNEKKECEWLALHAYQRIARASDPGLEMPSSSPALERIHHQALSRQFIKKAEFLNELGADQSGGRELALHQSVTAVTRFTAPETST
jgi:hypothetical protein